jgi:hypothetical protein
LARELGDVLHYFIPEPDPVTPRQPRAVPGGSPLAIVAVPVGERDVVRAAFVWNLAVEAARRGAAAAVIAAGDEATESLWPQPGRGPLGTEFVPTFAPDLPSLAATALEVARTRPPTAIRCCDGRFSSPPPSRATSRRPTRSPGICSARHPEPRWA